MATVPFSVSVIMPNYNYEKYVGAAIDSALALDWPDVEIIIVDDGSTDKSRKILEEYGDKITRIYQENSGQVVACNRGFAASRGDIVIFLDSDDLLYPSLIKEIASVWGEKVSKVQYQMQIIDGDGLPTGRYLPQFIIMPTPELIKRWYFATGVYPTPPGSGNAYARNFLQKVYPLDNSCGSASDSIPLAAAPYLGDIVTIAKPLAAYRVHGKNQGAMKELHVQRFRREVTRSMQRIAYARKIAQSASINFPEGLERRGLHLLQYRLCSIKLAPQDHPIANDSVAKVVKDVIIGAFYDQGMTKSSVAATVVWCVIVALLPNVWALSFVQWRFAPSTQPEILRRCLKFLHVIK